MPVSWTTGSPMTRRLAIFGDIHGDAIRLERLASSLACDDRQLIFVGDYVNRGPDSKRVLDYLCDLEERAAGRHCFLLGNHERALMRYIADATFGDFALLGGIATIRSYVPRAHGDVHKAFRDAFPRRHSDFLSRLQLYHEEPGLLVSHTGYDPIAPKSRSPEDMVDRGHPDMFDATTHPQRLVVCGHYVQRRMRYQQRASHGTTPPRAPVRLSVIPMRLL
jgi:serine/threonine protein phosphatase 1